MMTSEQRLRAEQAQQKAEAIFWLIVIAAVTLAGCVVVSHYLPDPPSPLPVPAIAGEDDE